MCQKCYDAAVRHFPGHAGSEYHELLMSATCFPFGGPDLVEPQLAEAAAAVGNDIPAAIARADKLMFEATEIPDAE